MADETTLIIGRMDQAIEDIRKDIAEIKAEQKEITEFIAAQKAGFKTLWFGTTLVGSIIIFFKDRVLELLGLKYH